MTGRVKRASNDELLRLIARLHFFAGRATVRLLLTVTNPKRARHKDGFWDLGDPGSVFVKDLSLTLKLPESDGPATVYCSREFGDAGGSYETPFELYQDSSGATTGRARTISIACERSPTHSEGIGSRQARSIRRDSERAIVAGMCSITRRF
jgi:hypothetical protein